MGRFLTPSKIALLVLASVYTDGVVPYSNCTKVLSFLIRNMLPDLKPPASSDDGVAAISLPLSEFDQVLTPLASSVPGRTIWDLFLKSLWHIDCSDSLDAFISNLPTLLAKSREQLIHERDSGEATEDTGYVLRTSPLGAFMRRCHLEYLRLQFQDSIALWQDLISYRVSSRASYEKKNAPDGRNALDANLSDFGVEASHPLAQIVFGQLAITDEEDITQYGSQDVERLFEFQVSELQRLGGRLPESMKENLNRMSQTGADVPKLAHYLRFLDSWRAGDFTSALDHLHRYFDYTMQSKDRTFYQYALLNLAILQADFGCHSEAIPAIQEAIATARENKDAQCLNFCMSWLYHFGRAFPTQMRGIQENGVLANETEGLSFLKSRARDAEMWSLLSTSLLSEAKIGLQHGESVAIAFENLVKASHITIVKTADSALGPVLLTKASVFARIGQSHMAWLSGQTFLRCYAHTAALEDVLKCKCRMAGLLAQQGKYADSDVMMADMPERLFRVLKYQKYWELSASLLNLGRYLHRGDLQAAALVIERLKGGRMPDIDADFTLAFLEIDYHIRRHELSTASDLTVKLAERSKIENKDVSVQVRLMAIRAQLFARAGKPLKGFTVIMRATNLAYNARLLPQLWDCITHLSTILLELQEFTPAQSLLEAILPQVLECQDCDLAARTYSLLADCHMGLAGLAGLSDEASGNTTSSSNSNGKSKSNKQTDFMNTAMGYIDASLAQWTFVEDLSGQCEMLSKKARIHYWRGDVVLANETASLYLKTKNEYIATRALS